jgi:hypothetical protein
VEWQGSARAATTIPSKGKQPTTRRQAHHHTSARQHRGEAGQLEKKLEFSHGGNPRCRRQPSRGREEAIEGISRTGRCAIVRSTRCAPSRRLTPTRVARIEGEAVAAIQSQELEREEERGAHRVDWSVGCDRATRSDSTRWAGARQLGRGGQVGQGSRWARRGF